jgi:hypothetical protein
MNTTLTEISNIFNLMVQADDRLKFYHFGWRSDINKNIDNNFDKGVKTGRLFPALHFDVPDFFQPSEELNYLGFKEDISVNLYFDDLQNYDNSGEQKTDNLIEQWAGLKQISEDFINNLAEVLQYYKAGFIRTVPRFEPKSNLFNDRLITFEVSFTLSHFSKCTEDINKIDFLSLPAAGCFPAYDLENYLKELECKSLQLDGVNEYINCGNNTAFDLESTDKFTFSVRVNIINYSLTTTEHIISKYSNPPAKGYFLAVQANKIVFNLQNNGGANGIIVATVNTFNISQWYNIIVTYDGSLSAAGVKIYVNGINEPINIIADTLTGSILNSETLKLGATLTPARYFYGKIASGKIWKTELSAAEILDYANCNINTPKESDLILNTNIGASFWNGTAFEIPDLTGITGGYTSVNSEELDLLTDCP